MNVEAFIRQHITTALVAEGFSEIVAQGGLLRVWNTTGDALRQAVRDVCMRIVSFVPASGRWGRQRLLSANRQRKSREEVRSPACSDFAIQYLFETNLSRKDFMKKHISKYQRNSSGDTQNLTAKHDTEQAGAA
ncbi:TPA: hypothetical protein JDD40_002310 [Salmonella enterica subsp. diarizonae]|nr:hypothetical protein [Salmonella enterica subsp. diarizonae]